MYDYGDVPQPAEGHDGVVARKGSVPSQHFEVAVEGLLGQEGLEVVTVLLDVLGRVTSQFGMELRAAVQLVGQSTEQTVSGEGGRPVITSFTDFFSFSSFIAWEAFFGPGS